jgi:c(7)-type cytochrome triheme protein
VSHVDEQKPDCTSCHPGRFRILRSTTGELRVTHEQMEAGRQCGACHDGKAARGLEDCAACHRDE